MAWLQDKLDGQDPVFWPERRYPWGVSEAFNPQHSDLLHLRLLLLKEACDELSAAKRARYYHTMGHYLQRVHTKFAKSVPAQRVQQQQLHQMQTAVRALSISS